MLDLDFYCLLQFDTVDDIWTRLKAVLEEARHRFISMVHLRKQQSPKWFDSERRHLLKCVHIKRHLSAKFPHHSNCVQKLV